MQKVTAGIVLILGWFSFGAIAQTPVTDYRVIEVKKASLTGPKREVDRWIRAHRRELIEINRQIWRHAEIALEEYQSSALLADFLEGRGFQVTRGVGGLPTAFVASYGRGEPVIGILAEYDALPGLSQDIVPYEKPVIPGAAGHGCGHNLFGVASTAAALAVQNALNKNQLPGTVILFGCPAEETVTGKVFMAREGIFDGLSCCLHWHPSDQNRVPLGSSNALKQFEVEFFGQTAHSAGDPWHGKSALDAIELTNIGLNYLREHLRPTARIHYVIQKGGDVPNVVPAHARGWYYVRNADWKSVESDYERVLDIIRGAALMTGTAHRVHYRCGVHELIPNRRGAELMQANLLLAGPPPFDPSDQEFARTIQGNLQLQPSGLSMKIEPLRHPQRSWGGGSTDVAEVSWLSPTVGLGVACKPVGTPGHHWNVVACGGMSIGHKGMLTAARVIAYTALDLFARPLIIDEMRREWQEKLGSREYRSPLPEDLAPPVKK